MRFARLALAFSLAATLAAASSGLALAVEPASSETGDDLQVDSLDLTHMAPYRYGDGTFGSSSLGSGPATGCGRSYNPLSPVNCGYLTQNGIQCGPSYSPFTPGALDDMMVMVVSATQNCQSPSLDQAFRNRAGWGSAPLGLYAPGTLGFSSAGSANVAAPLRGQTEPRSVWSHTAFGQSFGGRDPFNAHGMPGSAFGSRMPAAGSRTVEGRGP